MKEHELDLKILHMLPMAPPPEGPLGNAAQAIDRLVRRGDAEMKDGVAHRTPKGDARLKGPRTPCCGVTLAPQFDGRDDCPVICWNPFNGVVQCHNCGEIFIPASAAMTLLSDDAAPYRLWVDAGGGMDEDCQPYKPEEGGS